MQDNKAKEMFAVIFTFAVMGIIGLSLYDPVEPHSVEDSEAALALLQLDEDDHHSASVHVDGQY